MFHNPSFWLAISFLLFCVLFFKYALPNLIQLMDSRSKQIADELNKARELKNKAEKLLADTKQYHHDSIAFSRKLIEDSKTEVEKFMIASVKDISEEMDRKMATIFERIKQEEQRAVREIKSNIVVTAIKIIEGNLLKVSKKSSQSAIDDAVIEVSKAIH